MVVLVAVVVAGAGYGLSHLGNSSRDHSTPVSRGPETYQPDPRVVVPPVVAGWQSVASRDGSYAYDVPPSWTPSPQIVHGWDTTAGSAGINLATSAFVGKGSCPGSATATRGGAGVTSGDQHDAEAAARQAVTEVGVDAYTAEHSPAAKVAFGPVEQASISLSGKTAPGRLVVAEVTASGAAPCQPPRALVGAVAIAGGSGSVVLAVYADEGSATRDDLVRILRSYRGVPAADRSTTTPPPTVR
ncbi:hypothetical protein [Amycolatopsis ultiminotia]|uniref:hypothetical protein n=1 Tax=Amycolatopsis ultiminotia TaxID=543629 RepID=UPI0031EBBBF7